MVTGGFNNQNGNITLPPLILQIGELSTQLYDQCHLEVPKAGSNQYRYITTYLHFDYDINAACLECLRWRAVNVAT